jgi:cephalosporin hydroxylase
VTRRPSCNSKLRCLYSTLLALAVLMAMPSIGFSEPNAGGEKVREMTDQEVIDRFYEIWGDHKKPTIWKNSFFGIETLQNPMDVWITMEIIWKVKPDFIVEAGAFRGGSALLWATILEQVNPEGRVITIDIEDRTRFAAKHDIWKRKIQFLLGSSTDPKIVSQVTKQVKGKKVLVILDSLHTKDHVLDELHAYGPLVNKGSYVIVQDGMVNGHPIRPDWGPGPYEAVEAFDLEANGFVIDKSKERLILTYNPNGFLKKVK